MKWGQTESGKMYKIKPAALATFAGVRVFICLTRRNVLENIMMANALVCPAIRGPITWRQTSLLSHGTGIGNFDQIKGGVKP
ncbi:MAG: hypothetical protein IH856_10835 [Deltaproteobacteria bacterium]|nr:hypothetical protein [Deltaproteobacteria bacterium]